MQDLLFVNAVVFDGASAERYQGSVLVRNGRIHEAGAGRLHRPEARVIDVKGATLMPGLIDAHVHVCCPHIDERRGDSLPVSMIAQHARLFLEASLQRGFTTVRDTGGADSGLHRAIECGWIQGPRLFYCGKAFSQTGGHGDLRAQHDENACACGAGYRGHLSQVVDGADPLRRAVREELRRGASFIKILASGGVASPTGSIHANQYSSEEIRAVVDEAAMHGAYVAAHAHPDAAVRRCIELGIRCIEHGTLIKPDTARLAAEADAAVVPTLAVIRELSRRGEELGLPRHFLEKIAQIAPAAMDSLDILSRAGVRIGFGTDLIGELHSHQCSELRLRGEVQRPIDVLRSATSVNAAILGRSEQLGRILPGYLADLVVIEGDPLDDLSCFADDGRHAPIVVRDGLLLKAPP